MAARLIPGPLEWSVLLDPPTDGARNMARDHALARGLPAGKAWLRIYRWKDPTISFGRNEPALGRYDRCAAERAGVSFVRRPTGGRAVAHDRELTYAVALRAEALGGPRHTYRAINQVLVDALRSLGVPAELAPSAPPRKPDSGPCFQAAAEGEVTVAGRKIVGSAQVRLGPVLLQHGSLLLEPAQQLITELRSDGGPSPGTPTSLLESTGGVPEWGVLVEAVLRALSERLGGTWGAQAPLDLATESPLLERYASEAWTWRR